MENDIKLLRSKIYKIALLLMVLLTVSCWREDLENCWKDDVTLIYTAEKFQEAPDGVSAPVLADVVEYFDYYLYRQEEDDLVLVNSGKVSNSSFGSADNYELNFNELPFGDYIIASVANNAKGFSEATDTVSLKMKYLVGQNNNYFVAQKKFTVDCYCNYTDFVKLYNTQGELEVRFYELPSNIVSASVSVTNLYDECATDTVYFGNMTLDTESNTIVEGSNKTLKMDLFTFPTIHDLNSRVDITLYMTTYGHGLVEAAKFNVPSIDILRNQTVRIENNFHGNISVQPNFKISINPDWDGVTDNGNTDI